MQYLKKLFTLSTIAVMLAPALALAAGAGVGASVNATVGANVPVAGASVGASTTVSATVTAKMKTAMGHADQEIDRRVAALNDLSARVTAMQKVTDSFKQTLAGNIQTEINGLTALKAKIEADTDAATLKTDVQSITDSYRIYMLVMPQSRIAAAADREVVIINMMNTLGSKLQARIQAAQTAGANVSALLAALTDMSSKMTDANTQAQAAVSVTATLAPDNGDKTKMAANSAALKTGRSDIQAAQKDLVAARKDVDTILKGLKAAASASGTSTTTVQTTTTSNTHPATP